MAKGKETAEKVAELSVKSVCVTTISRLNVIPEIEETTNKLLSILSAGSMRVELKTQRTLKTGGVSDTLDIRVELLVGQS